MESPPITSTYVGNQPAPDDDQRTPQRDAPQEYQDRFKFAGHLKRRLGESICPQSGTTTEEASLTRDIRWLIALAVCPNIKSAYTSWRPGLFDLFELGKRDLIKPNELFIQEFVNIVECWTIRNAQEIYLHWMVIHGRHRVHILSHRARRPRTKGNPYACRCFKRESSIYFPRI